MQDPTSGGGHVAPRSMPSAVFALLAAFALLALVPRIRESRALLESFAAAGGALLLWALIVWRSARRDRRALAIEFTAVPAHYVQALVQLSILAYWGWYSTEDTVALASGVYAQAPLILAQALFLYALDALLSWSRGRVWRLGFGPWPIVLSTNLLLWFKDDWYLFQFLMVGAGALGKHFITWTREGRRTHVFNPSAFGQTLCAIVLIATGTTNDCTWGREIAATFETPPHIYLEIFLLGLLVQFLFGVTLMTLSAALVLCLANLAYTRFTGSYWFMATNIGSTVFLGLHLLVTDPSTSPRSNIGRVVFGALYGISYFVLFRVLDATGVPLFWDKLLPVCFLNLSVPLLDRWARAGLLGRLERAWAGLLAPRALNLLHMGCWAALFLAMLATGFVEAPHPGTSIAFWKQARSEKKPLAEHFLAKKVASQASLGSPAANNELGLLYMEGVLFGAGRTERENHATAARYFAQASEMGDLNGSANVVAQFLFLREWRSKEDVAAALDRLETYARDGSYGRAAFLVGHAYETGRGRPIARSRALELYRRGAALGDPFAIKAMVRVALEVNARPSDPSEVMRVLESACAGGDAESCWYLAYLHPSAAADGERRKLLERACALGMKQACAACAGAELPPFAAPYPMLVPGWSSDFPLAGAPAPKP